MDNDNAMVFGQDDIICHVLMLKREMNGNSFCFDFDFQSVLQAIFEFEFKSRYEIGQVSQPQGSPGTSNRCTSYNQYFTFCNPLAIIAQPLMPLTGLKIDEVVHKTNLQLMNKRLCNLQIVISHFAIPPYSFHAFKISNISLLSVIYQRVGFK